MDKSSPTLDLVLKQELPSFSELDTPSTIQIINGFSVFYDNYQSWKEHAESIWVTSADQVAEMKAARKARLALKEIRGRIEEKRLLMGAQSLRYKQALDAAAKLMRTTIQALEDHLLKQETFLQIQEQKAIEEKYAKRAAILKKYGLPVSPQVEWIAKMGADEFKAYGKALMVEKKKKEAEEQAEAAEAEKAKRLEEENQKLKAQLAAKEPKIYKAKPGTPPDLVAKNQIYTYVNALLGVPIPALEGPYEKFIGKIQSLRKGFFNGLKDIANECTTSEAPGRQPEE